MGLFNKNSKKIPQVIDGETLIEILKLWKEFDDNRHQNPPQMVTGILENLVGLMINDTFNDSTAIVQSKNRENLQYTTMLLHGKRTWANQVRVYQSGITVSQLSKNPNYQELMSDPKDWVYYNTNTQKVHGTIEILRYFYPERRFVFVYGTEYYKEPCVNKKIFISSPSLETTEIDSFLVVKDSYTDKKRDSISWELIWSNGNVFSLLQPINKPFTPQLVKIEKSEL